MDDYIIDSSKTENGIFIFYGIYSDGDGDSIEDVPYYASWIKYNGNKPIFSAVDMEYNVKHKTEYATYETYASAICYYRTKNEEEE